MLELPIRTPRLLLRDYAEADEAAVHMFACDPQVTRFTTWGPNTSEDTRAFVRHMLKIQRKQPRTTYELAVVRHEDGLLIGGCGLDITEPYNAAAEIGYVFRRDCWGQGYASEVAAALLAVGFEQLGLHRIYATCAPDNIGSARVLEKIGMRREGYLRESKRFRDGWRDSLLYARLETDSKG